MLTASASSLEDAAPAIVRRAVAKRKTKARKRTAAKAEAAAEVKRTPAHPADATPRPGAFFNISLGGKRRGRAAPEPEDEATEPPPVQRGPGGKFQRAASALKDEAARVLSDFEAATFETTLQEVFVKAWEALDAFMTATAFDGDECVIWRSIDDDDTAFLVRRALKVAKKNPVIAQQIRILVDHWDDYRVVAILGPRVIGSLGWYHAHGLDTRQWGGPAFPPTSARKRPANAPQSAATSVNGHIPHYAPDTEAFTYGN